MHFPDVHKQRAIKWFASVLFDLLLPPITVEQLPMSRGSFRREVQRAKPENITLNDVGLGQRIFVTRSQCQKVIVILRSNAWVNYVVS